MIRLAGGVGTEDTKKKSYKIVRLNIFVNYYFIFSYCLIIEVVMTLKV